MPHCLSPTISILQQPSRGVSPKFWDAADSGIRPSRKPGSKWANYEEGPDSELGYWAPFSSSQASLIAQLVKNPPAMQDTPVQFLGQEDLLEKG